MCTRIFLLGIMICIFFCIYIFVTEIYVQFFAMCYIIVVNVSDAASSMLCVCT